MKREVNLNEIPTENDWGGYKDDLDLQDLHRLFAGKRAEDIYYYFKNGANVSRFDELLYCNRKIFQYYIYGYIMYLFSEIGNRDYDAMENFLHLLINREQRDPGSVCSIFKNKVELKYTDNEFKSNTSSYSIEDAVSFIEKKYNAKEIDNELYDELPDLIDLIRKQCK